MTWKRLLWVKQDYPDNYTDPNFLKILNQIKEHKQNHAPATKPTSTYSSTVVFSNIYMFFKNIINISLMYIVFIEFYYYKNYNPVLITSVLTTLTLLCIFFNNKLTNNNTIPIKSPIIIIFTMLSLSPVIKSLSKTTSSDSIWNLSFWLTVLCLISTMLNDSNIIQTNLLLSNFVVLASRLESTTFVFCFILTSIELNILLPYFQNWLLFLPKQSQEGQNSVQFFVRSSVTKLLQLSLFLILELLSNGTVLLWVYDRFFSQTMNIFEFLSISIINIVLSLVGLTRYLCYWQSHYYTRNKRVINKWDIAKPVLD
ncbi:phosphatidylinositol N-acetylglucosaminyltransferase SCDLUD_002015 [Saccharomycodes ludwigii]|uniref:phosphatidylinositol N-acetylglucosaminyltransferase n=1 Tax=Saccharomycodes ludwigii TaxID=36035 RepID=UPI001E859137|nr:hypothetical protein SCDLUD_002015 [Saccharomycodes ludwigii]KAH3902200.1 hypothetical protein SCDLUD_002015 [Saccharomycodes ludwigii]